MNLFRQLCIALVFCVASGAALAVETINITCSGAANNEEGLGLEVEDLTATSVKLFQEHGAFVDNGEEFLCYFIVPGNYDDSASAEATVQFYGWVPTETVCGLGVTCADTDDLSWAISNRAYSDPELASASWDTVGNTDTRDMPDSVCQTVSRCYVQDQLGDFSGQAVNDVTDWDIGDFVVLRFVMNTDEYLGDYYVPGIAKLTYND